MKIKHAKNLTTLLIFVMVILLLPSTVFAGSMPGFKLPVTVKLSGTPPTNDEDYSIILKADNPGYPMPEGSVDGSYKMTIKGEGSKNLPKIEFSSLGVYTYKIYQLSGSNKLAKYDDSVYNLVVFVTNSEDGTGLEITVNLYLQGEKEKHDEVIFENKYEKPVTPPPTEKPVVPEATKGTETVVTPEVPEATKGAETVVTPEVPEATKGAQTPVKASPTTRGTGSSRFQQTSTSTLGLGMFGLLSVLGIGFVVRKRKIK